MRLKDPFFVFFVWILLVVVWFGLFFLSLGGRKDWEDQIIGFLIVGIERWESLWDFSWSVGFFNGFLSFMVIGCLVAQ